MKIKEYQYTFDVLEYTRIPEVNFGKEYTFHVVASNYIEATLKADKLYPPERYRKLLTNTTSPYWPTSGTLYPKFNE